MIRHASPLIPLLIFALSLLAFIPNLQLPLNIYDEGLVTYGALRTLNGDMPYRDFWTIYAPGQFYLLAAIFDLFGTSIAVERFWDALVKASLSTMIYVVSRRQYPGWQAVFCWLMATIWLTQFGFHNYPMFPALLLGFVSIQLISWALVSSKRVQPLFLGGVMAGLATLFRHDFGVYLIVASGLAFLLSYRLKLIQLGAAASRLIFYAIGIMLVLTPTIVYFVSSIAPIELLNHLFIFPSTTFPVVRNLPYPLPIPNPQQLFSATHSLTAYISALLGQLPFTILPVILAVVGVRLYLDIRDPDRIESQQVSIWPGCLIALLGILLLNQAYVRSDAIHLMPSALMTIILIPYAMGIHQQLPRIDYKLRLRFGRYAALLFLTIILLTGPIIKQARLYSTLDVTDLTPQIATLIDPDLADTVTYVQAHSQPSEPIFIGLPTHDRIFINDILLYFLVNRPSATRYHELHPGVATTIDVQREMIAELRQQNVHLIIINHGITNPAEPNTSSVSSGVTLLDDFIKKQYHEEQRFGRYSIHRRG